MIPRYGPGPHSTPCIVQDRVCAVGGTGILTVCDLKTGDKIWTRDLWQTYQATKLERGFAASPIAFEGKLILPVGGKGTGVVAFDLLTGQEVWRSTDFEAAYASPAIVKIENQPQLVCLLDQNLVALNPTNGKLLWDFPYPTFKTVHVASAVALSDNRILVLSSNMATMIRIVETHGEFGPKKLWESKALTPQVGNVVQIGDQLIGPNSGSSAAVLAGISEATGDRLWRSRLSGIGFCYRTNDGFIALSESGALTFNQIKNGTVENLATHSGSLVGRIWNTSAFSPDMIFVRDENSIQAFRFNRKK
jgi:outer membrane protein assembly factor BamB